MACITCIVNTVFFKHVNYRATSIMILYMFYSKVYCIMIMHGNGVSHIAVP